MTPARYLMPALVAPTPRRAAVPVRASRAVVDTVERHRLALPALKMIAAVNEGRIGHGIDAVFVAAARTLPVLTKAASARIVAAQEAIFDAVSAQPYGERVVLLLAICHELMATAPLTPDLDAPCPWRDVLRALGAAQTAAGAEITEAHERAAAAIVAGVTL